MVTSFPGPFCCSITYTFCLYHGYIISWITVAASLTQSVCTMVTSFPGPFCYTFCLYHGYLNPGPFYCSITYTFCLCHSYIIS